MPMSSSLLILLCVSALSCARPYDEEYQQPPPFKQELAKQIIPDNRISEYQQKFDQITKEIRKISPSLRQVQTSIETFLLQRDDVSNALPEILHYVATDLGTDRLDDELIDIFEKGSELIAKIRVQEHKKEYSRVSLSFSYNEETYFIVGAVGFRQKYDNPDEVEFGFVLYQERWKENLVDTLKRWLSWGDTVGHILEDSDVEKYAMYRLYQRLDANTCAIDSYSSKSPSSDAQQENDEDNQEAVEESNLVLWLKENNYEETIPIFEKETVTLEELVEMGEDKEVIRQYLKDINIPFRFITRIAFRIKKMYERKNDNQKKEENYRRLPIKQELAEFIIEHHKLPIYKQLYKQISTAIKGMAPSSRIITNFIESTTIKRDEINVTLPELLVDISLDLGRNLDGEVQELITKRAKLVKRGLQAAKKEYARVSLSRRYDQETYFIVGAVGFRTIENHPDEVEFGVALYQERWMENWIEIVTRWLKFGDTPSNLLNETDVEKFAMYRLYLKLA